MPPASKAAPTLDTGIAQSRESTPTPKAPLRKLPRNQALLRLQRKCSCEGSGSCDSCNPAKNPEIQTKIPIGPRDDAFEREADATAERIMRMHAPGTPRLAEAPARVQRAGGEEEDELDLGQVQRKPAGSGSSAPILSLSSLTHGGSPLPNPVRNFFETRFGRDFSDVRVHTGEDSHHANVELHSRAFTYRDHVWFSRNETVGSNLLLAHELVHVTQQNDVSMAVGTALVQRDDDPAKKTEDDNPYVPEDEEPKYKYIKYEGDVPNLNAKWFQLLSLSDANPFAPFSPYDTPNAFINRVVEWQKAVYQQHDGVSFSEFVFAAAEAQSKVREGTFESTLAGLEEVSKTLREGTFTAGLRIDPDGVLGPATLWTMIVADSLAATPDGLKLLKKVGLPYDTLWKEEPLAVDNFQASWRAAHAYLFSKPKFRATWNTMARADIVIDTFESLDLLGDLDQKFLVNLFFEGELPAEVEIKTNDLLAILARGYQGEALEGIASIFEVDRTYYHAVDLERLVRAKNPKWLDETSLKMGETLWPRAHLMLQRLDLEPPSTKEAKAALEGLEANSGQILPGQPMSVLAVVYQLPERSPQFWHDLAQKYVDEKAALEEAAEEATRKKLEDLEKEFETRLAGAPDIGKDDASAFLELLTGDAFMRAQNTLHSEHTSLQISRVEINEKLQPQRAKDKVDRLYSLAHEKTYLVVQLGDDPKNKFPLFALQIDSAHEAADRSGKSPLIFDLVDTPQHAMHQYTPHRFTARKSGDGSEAAINPWQLKDDPDALSWENWKYRTAGSAHFGPLDPVLVELHQFNPDAGKLVQLWRQSFGTDKIMVQYVWTLGGSLPALSDNLWDAQGKINIVGWIDAVFTVVALASLVAAPLMAGAEAGAVEVAGGVTEAAVNAAVRRALLTAIRRFAVSEAIGEILNRISYHLNESDAPEGVKKAWSYLMWALLIFGAGKVTRQGIRAFKNVGSAAFRAELEALEKEIETQAKSRKAEVSEAEAAAEADIKKQTEENFREKVSTEGGETPTGPERVRSDDPRAAGVSEKPTGAGELTPEDRSELRKKLGDDVAAALEDSTNEPTRKRLALIKDPEAIRNIVAAVKPKELAKLLASVGTETLLAFATVLDKTALEAILKAFASKTAGIRLMKAFAGDPARLSRLLAGLDANSLLLLADNPGAERFAQVAAKVDPQALVGAILNIGEGKVGSRTRFRNLLEAVGTDHTALVLNTYSAGEIKARWHTSGALSAAQYVTSLAIKRGGVPTKFRLSTGIPVPKIETARPGKFEPGHFTAFFAQGPENAAPSVVRSMLAQVQEATAAAANKLDDLIKRANAGMLTDADLQGVAPEARKTVEAFLKTAPDSAIREALYGSALQYMAEAELRAANGGALPAGLVVRRPETRAGGTVIPDAQLELTLKEGLRFPKKNKVERVVFDWTTPGQAGKIEKYAGGQPPVTFGVEIIQVITPPVHPKPDVEPDTETE